MSKKGILKLFRLFAISLLLAASLANAETIEEVINPKTTQNQWVSDMAGVIEESIERDLNALIKQLEQKTTVEIAVVTIRRTDGRTPKEFATELFNRWGIGKKGKDNGVLVLLVMEARQVEVETGYGIEGVLTDGKVGDILDSEVIPNFRKGDIGGGLLAGVQEIVKTLTGEREIPQNSQKSLDAGNRTVPKESPEILPISILGLLITLLIGYFIWSSRRPRYCSSCHKKMRRLTEKQDDAYLAVDQKFEEELGSVDYKVWRCDDCQELKIEKTISWFTKYKRCPQCQHYTLRTNTVRLVAPTYSREGVAEERHVCRFPNCKYIYAKKRSIPHLEESSNGGGGDSFGGGSSGGGGGGRSW